MSFSLELQHEWTITSDISILIFCFYHVHTWLELWWKQFIMSDFQIEIPFSSHNFSFKHYIQNLIFFEADCGFQIIKYLIRILFKSDVDFIQYLKSVLNWHIIIFMISNISVMFQICELFFFWCFFFAENGTHWWNKFIIKFQKIFESMKSPILSLQLIDWWYESITKSTFHIDASLLTSIKFRIECIRIFRWAFFFVESLFNKRFFNSHFHNCWKQLKIIN